jgi:hypothetical protein
MKFSVKWGVRVLCCSVSFILLGNLGYSAMPKADQIESDKSGRSREQPFPGTGKIVSVKTKKTGSLTAVLIRDDTKIEPKHGRVKFLHHNDMDVTGIAPGPSIEAAGVTLFVRYGL